MVSSKTGTEDHLHQKCQLQDYQNKDRLSVYTSIRYFYYSENLNWATQNLRLGHMRAAGWTWLI